MKIPPQYQVFDVPVTLSDKDADRLRPYLSGWHKLHPALLQGVNQPDLERLVILEILGSRRKEILRRLLMRLGKVSRAKIERRIQEALT